MPVVPRRPYRPARLVLAACAGTLLAGAALLAAATRPAEGAPALHAVPHAAAAASPAPVDLLDVVRVGDGSVPLSSAAAPVAVVPLLSSGVLGTPIPLPASASGAQHPFVLSGSAVSEGSLALSADGRYLTLAGYAAPPGTPAIASTSSASVARVVARIDAAGGIDTATLLGDAFSGVSPRGAVSDDGSRVWATGAGGNAAVVFQPMGGPAAVTLLVGGGATARVPRIATGALWYTTGTGTPGVFRLGPAAGDPSAPPPAADPGAPVLVAATGNSAYGLALVSLGGGAAPDTAYVADGSSLRKFAIAGDGTWTALGSVAHTSSLGQLAVRADGGAARIYVTDLAGSRVLALTDAGGPGAAPGGSLATVAVAPPGTTYKGIALAPRGQVAPGQPPVLALAAGTPQPLLVVAGQEPGAGAELHLTVAAGDSSADPAGIAVEASSSDDAVLPAAGVTVGGSGSTRTVALQAAAPGSARLLLVATDALGRSARLQVDVLAVAPGTPDTAIATAPAATTTARSATLAWTASLPGATFECSLDGAAWAACSSPRTYNGLALGQHALAVRALRGSFRDPLPARAAWAVVPFAGAPATTLTAALSPSGVSRRAAFAWTADQPGARFECSLDGAAWAGCSSPRTYNGLTAGAHVLRVRAVGATGLVEAVPAAAAWTVGG